MERRKIIAIIGDANIDNNITKQRLSEKLGKLIIDNGYILATGGLGGVMEYSSKGAKFSSNYKEGSIIGILPYYDSESGNPYIDISIPTGMGITRNLLLISSADAIVAVGGGSGTLNEITAAWQMNKLIVSLDVEGWSGKVGGISLDNKRDDIIYPAKTPEDAIKLIKEKLSIYAKKKYKGIGKKRISEEYAQKIISKNYNIAHKLTFLGKGSEGFVFTDYIKIYKLIDKTDNCLELYWSLLSLSEKLKRYNTSCIPAFSVELHDIEQCVSVTYRYEKSIVLHESPSIDSYKIINLLKELLKVGWVLADFQPKNIRLSPKGYLFVADIGRSLIPVSEYMFESMVRRAFVSFELNDKLSSVEIKKYLSQVNKEENFSQICYEFNFSEDIFKEKYKNFLEHVKSISKSDVLNPLISEILFNKSNIETIFDYGSGHGDISKILHDQKKKVFAYEPDNNIIKKYKNNYKDINLITLDGIKNYIEAKIKFDCVLCSLVLCHPLAETEEKALECVRNIMSNIKQLTNKFSLIAICNPLYTYNQKSQIQQRILREDYKYEKTSIYSKKIFSTGNIRKDFHRPISFYENLFTQFDFSIKEIYQTKDSNDSAYIINSDFIIFFLEKNDHS